jgi:hypothetical protein
LSDAVEETHKAGRAALRLSCGACFELPNFVYFGSGASQQLIILYIFVEFYKTFFQTILQEIDFGLVCSQSLEIHMHLGIKDIPALEVQFLRFLKKDICLIQILRKGLEVPFFKGMVPILSEQLLSLRILFDNPSGDIPDSIACRRRDKEENEIVVGIDRI